ncbi:unnamed protein product [Mytilus edulis]|uniref:Uncharacterized protein n=1 Tax=Mytilus edulis TaxID=6550 RepID=A0A8S3SVN1_MYTED|nr:unnamed protein product [Mytilus edulis]
MIKQIIDSNNSCPNDFWNTIKKLKKENFKDPSSNIQPKEWFKYFNKLMNTDYDKNVCNDKKEYTTFKDCNTCTKMLNSFITTEEVVIAAKSLKNNKASGSDCITNEMLQISCYMNIDVYVKLFNLILKSGIYPTLWRKNFIKPIFKGGCFNDPSNYREV